MVEFWNGQDYSYGPKFAKMELLNKDSRLFGFGLVRLFRFGTAFENQAICQPKKFGPFEYQTCSLFEPHYIIKDKNLLIKEANIGSSPTSEVGELSDDPDLFKFRNRINSKSVSVCVSVLNCSISQSFGARFRCDSLPLNC